jgi:hypothetical protein
MPSDPLLRNMIIASAKKYMYEENEYEEIFFLEDTINTKRVGPNGELFDDIFDAIRAWAKEEIKP